MITTITKNIFEANIPAAMDPQSDIFDSCRMAFEFAEQELISSYFGEECIKQIVSNNASALSLLQRYIVIRGFADNISMLDVTLTNNGFAVTSTQQMAPASKERVQSLLKSCNHLAYITLNNLIDVVINTPDLLSKLQPVINPQNIVPHFFWRVNDICYIFGISQNVIDSDIVTSELEKIDAAVAPVISVELLNDLWQKVANNSQSEEEKQLLILLKHAYAVIHKNGYSRSFLTKVVSYIDNNISSFPVFKNSSVFKARNVQRYENKKNDSVFFFGK